MREHGGADRARVRTAETRMAAPRGRPRVPRLPGARFGAFDR